MIPRLVNDPRIDGYTIVAWGAYREPSITGCYAFDVVVDNMPSCTVNRCRREALVEVRIHAPNDKEYDVARACNQLPHLYGVNAIARGGMGQDTILRFRDHAYFAAMRDKYLTTYDQSRGARHIVTDYLGSDAGRTTAS
jgi:hypothetical protein